MGLRAGEQPVLEQVVQPCRLVRHGARRAACAVREVRHLVEEGHVAQVGADSQPLQGPVELYRPHLPELVLGEDVEPAASRPLGQGHAFVVGGLRHAVPARIDPEPVAEGDPEVRESVGPAERALRGEGVGVEGLCRPVKEAHGQLHRLLLSLRLFCCPWERWRAGVPSWPLLCDAFCLPDISGLFPSLSGPDVLSGRMPCSAQ